MLSNFLEYLCFISLFIFVFMLRYYILCQSYTLNDIFGLVCNTHDHWSYFPLNTSFMHEESEGQCRKKNNILVVNVTFL